MYASKGMILVVCSDFPSFISFHNFIFFLQVVWIKGHGHKKIIVLKNDMKGEGTCTLYSLYEGLIMGFVTC